MPTTPDPITALTPALAVGERLSVRVEDPAAREVIGFVTTLTDATLGIVDRRGAEHVLPREHVRAARRVAVSLGRRPESTPRDLLDALATRAGASGTPWVARLSALLADRTPPARVPAWGEVADVGGVPARFEGEWVTLAGGDEDAWVAAGWWATRMGARSIQVRTDDPGIAAALDALGFTRLPRG